MTNQPPKPPKRIEEMLRSPNTPGGPVKELRSHGAGLGAQQDWQPKGMPCRRPAIQLRIFFAWYDIWIGVFIQRKKRRVYFLPLPFCGVCFYAGPKWERGMLGGRVARRHWFTRKVYILMSSKVGDRRLAAGEWIEVTHPEGFEPLQDGANRNAGLLQEDLGIRRALDRHECEAIRSGGGPIQKKG
jgi:hypothetical protein